MFPDINLNVIPGEILIVEDSPVQAEMLRHLLQKQGYRVIVAASSAQALDYLRQHTPPMIITDIIMPDMDGFELCRRIRALDLDQMPYIIILTVQNEKADIVNGLNAGADDYLAKPYDFEELKARVAVGQRMIALQYALAHQATHDLLTGILNRRAIDQIFARLLARAQREQNGLVIGICDLDHFKEINDTYGHQVGDEVLCGVVRVLENNLRVYDQLGRWGGEEFLLIAPGHIEPNIEGLYERLRLAVAETPIETRVGKISITVSIGVSCWSGKETTDELLSSADTALFLAKEQGRNRICLAETGCI